MIGELLGHRSQQTTARYSHISLDTARAATEQVGKAVDTAAGKVVPLRKDAGGS